MQFFSKTDINFISKRPFYAGFSAVLIVVGLIAAFVLGPRLSIDFQGGTEVAVAFENEISTSQVRDALNTEKLDGNEIKSFGGDNQFLIRVKDFDNASVVVLESLEQNIPNNSFEVLKVDKIGPKIGSELWTNALLAVLLAVLAILIYIAFRFEFVFGLGAIVALVHDVLITFAIIVVVHHTGIINLEINQGIFAALLTVVGYSINDTVIIFDRIRENADVHKGMNFVKMVNMSLNETLSRTVNTTLTSILVFLTIIFFGGPVIQGLAFTMFIGIVIGTYSSIFIASSFVIWYNQKVKKMNFESKGNKKERIGIARV